MNSSDEHLVDVILPPDYKPNGETIGIVEAIRSGAWLHVTNLWIYRAKPKLEILFQQRDEHSPMFASKLDCAVAGYLEAGEDGLSGAIREAEEELGIQINPGDAKDFGRHFNAGLDHRQRERKRVINKYVIKWDGSLKDLKLDSSEVPALFWVPVEEFLGIEEGGSITIEGIISDGTLIRRVVTAEDFVPNIDGYHYQMAERIQRLEESE